MGMLFNILVLLGFVVMLVSKFAPGPWPERIAWGCWTVACLLWVLAGSGNAL